MLNIREFSTQIQFYVTNGGNALAGNPVTFYWIAYA